MSLCILLLVPLAAELYLDYEGAGIAVKPVFVYGHIRFNPVVQAAPEADRVASTICSL